MEIKKMIGLLILVMLILTACGSGATGVKDVELEADTSGITEEDADEISGSEQGSQPSNDENGQTGEELRGDLLGRALDPATQLVVGTLLLEETDLAVDTEQAATLLPYWKLYITLTESDITAWEEMDALLDEIQEIMTADQVNYIAGLELTQEDLMNFMNELGISMDFRPEGVGDGEEFGFPGGGPGGDGLPEGFQPGEGGGPGGRQGFGGEGANLDPQMRATMEAAREEMGGGFMRGSPLTIPLIEELISLLEDKASS